MRLTPPPDRSEERGAGWSVAIVADGWADDVRRAVASVLAHTDLPVVLLDNASDAAEAVVELARDDRVTAWRLDKPVGWSAARRALLRADPVTVQVWLDPSVELTGDAVAPLRAVLVDPSVSVAGGWGVALDEDWHGVHDVGPGAADAVLGYLLAVRRDAALETGVPDAKARFYRNADIEMCLDLRAAGGRCVATEPLPVVRHRHRGYHDTDPAYRDAESRRNWARLLRHHRPQSG